MKPLNWKFDLLSNHMQHDYTHFTLIDCILCKKIGILSSQNWQADMQSSVARFVNTLVIDKMGVVKWSPAKPMLIKYSQKTILAYFQIMLFIWF